MSSLKAWGIWGKQLNSDAKDEWVREQVSVVFFSFQITTCFVAAIAPTLGYFECPQLIHQAWRCHDVLLKHTKSKRKYGSPAMIKKSSQGLLGDRNCSVFFQLIFNNLPSPLPFARFPDSACVPGLLWTSSRPCQLTRMKSRILMRRIWYSSAFSWVYGGIFRMATQWQKNWNNWFAIWSRLTCLFCKKSNISGWHLAPMSQSVRTVIWWNYMKPVNLRLLRMMKNRFWL